MTSCTLPAASAVVGSAVFSDGAAALGDGEGVGVGVGVPAGLLGPADGVPSGDESGVVLALGVVLGLTVALGVTLALGLTLPPGLACPARASAASASDWPPE